MKTTPDRPFQDLADEWLVERVMAFPRWEALARDKDRIDCFGFIHEFYRDIIGLDIPEVPAQAGHLAISKYFDYYEREVLHLHWDEIDEPEPWCVVTMGRKGRVYHVGLYHPTRLIYHVSFNAGICARELRLLQATLGYTEFKFYKHKEFTWQSR